MPNSTADPVLLLNVAVAVIAVVLLIARLKVHAFLALTLASIYVGLCARMDLPRIAQAYQEGVGAMLGSIAVVVGLGMVLGKLLAESGGAQVIAHTLIRWFGERYLDWALLWIGIIVGIPVFFTVGVVLLVPILFTVLGQTRQPLFRLGIPLLAGLSVMHGLVPPHPGPMAAIGITKADAGKTILFSLLIGLPAAALAGPFLGRFLARRIPVTVSPGSGRVWVPSEGVTPPGFGLALFTILLPVLLMLAASVADLLLSRGNRVRDWMDFIGSPTVALLLASSFAFYSFGAARGLSRERLLRCAEESLAPAGSILLVVGAGGGFNRILVASGVGEALAAWAQATTVSPLLLGWMMAALIRVATGSATVAITTAAGLVAPVAASVPGTSMELLVIAMGAGSLILSHVNDGGFWFVREYLGITVPQTLWSWTVMETLISCAALLLVLLVNALIRA